MSNTKDLYIKKLEEIQTSIDSLKNTAKNIKGSKTEVYTRIVGYMRDVTQWNKGKKEEYEDRLTFRSEVDNCQCQSLSHFDYIENLEEIKSKISSEISFYLAFHNHNCPKCPEVINFIKSCEIKGELIDTKTPNGFDLAVKYNVMSTPTVIFFNKNQEIISICHNVKEIKNLGFKELATV